MSGFDFTVDCKKVEVEYSRDRELVELTVNQACLYDIIKEVGADNILEHIDEAVIATFVEENEIEIS